jgi:hypothetical protein
VRFSGMKKLLAGFALAIALAIPAAASASDGYVTAYYVLQDSRLGTDPTSEDTVGPGLYATVFDRGPIFGARVDFIVKGQWVCSAPVGNAWLYAKCSSPSAYLKAVQAGGYEARWNGHYDRAGLFYDPLPLLP